MLNIFDLLNPIQWATFFFSILGMGFAVLSFFIDKRGRTSAILWFCFALNVFIKMIISMSYGYDDGKGIDQIIFINDYACGIFIYGFLVMTFESICKIMKIKHGKRMLERRKNGL